MKKFKKVIILDTVIFYPEHRKLLNSIAEEVLEYQASLPESLEKQYTETPELFLNNKCYTQIASNNTPLQLLMNRIEGADVIVSCWTDIPDEILILNPQIKLIIFWTHEKEHRINLELANKLGIVVKNIPDYGTDAVAEVVFAGLWQLLLRNYQVLNTEINDNNVAHAVAGYVFNYFRKLQINEKNTRYGKFTHHFHKIGMAKFDFGSKSLDSLIPERLIAHKRVGLLNLRNTEEAVRMLSVFGVTSNVYQVSDNSLATYYKFLAENEIIFYDSRTIDYSEIKKGSIMFGNKFVDIVNLPTSNYIFDGKTFGVVGLGRIGMKVAFFAKKLGFRVIYYSKKQKTELEHELGIQYVEIDELVQTSDIVSIHLPAHKAENLINNKLIAKLKAGSIFINTADGNAIDQVALTKRMFSGDVYAYLDVYPGLPRKDIVGMPMSDKSDWKIRKELPHSVLTYRAGWKTQESIRVKTYKLLGEMTNFLLEYNYLAHKLSLVD